MIHIKKITIFLILNLFLIVSCSQTEQQDNSPVTKVFVENKTPETEEDDKEDKEPITGSTIKDVKILSDKSKNQEPFIDLKKLEEELKEVIKEDHNIFKRDPDNKDYFRSSSQKNSVIHTISDKEDYIENAKQFCAKYCARSWNALEYYTDSDSMKKLTPVLHRNNFSRQQDYGEYESERTLIDYRVEEKAYEVANGHVLELQISQLIQDDFGNFQGVWADTLLVYKIPCSPNTTILLRPELGVHKGSTTTSTLNRIYRNWDDYLVPIREEFLDYANDLLIICPVKKEFFSQYNFPSYSKSKTLSYYWRTNYEYLWDLKTTL